jgi:V8-like Glu-specific endopeptidase
MHLRAARTAGNSGQWARWSWRAGSVVAVLAVVVLSWLLADAVPAAVRSPPRPAAPTVLVPSVPLAGTPFDGTPAVGALFTMTGGRLGRHFCTASVIDSPARDLLVTAAHCLSGYADASPAGLAFVPGYINGRVRYGIWTVTRIFADSAWQQAADPDDDVAFLAVAEPGGKTRIENVTGAERLGVGQPPASVVRVIGYPETLDQPIACQNRISAFSSSQLEFDCDDYTPGTSGGPLLTGVDAATGEGTVIGVIGGYEQGGDSPDVSYAAAFGLNVRALYDTAVSGR